MDQAWKFQELGYKRCPVDVAVAWCAMCVFGSVVIMQMTSHDVGFHPLKNGGQSSWIDIGVPCVKTESKLWMMI